MKPLIDNLRKVGLEFVKCCKKMKIVLKIVLFLCVIQFINAMRYILKLQLKTLTNAVRTAKSNAANAQAAASGVQRSLREKEELLEAARRRVDELSNQLRSARQDLMNTSRAAAKANASAHEAKVNARNKRRLANLRRLRMTHSIATRATS